jgi:O-acetyl-ADP-ribose deacetylase (regulator of RNase III)
MQFDGCPTGEVRVTPGCELPAKYVIHAVGPVWHGGEQGEPELLASCYSKAVETAFTLGLRSIAFPAISTGVYGYPPALAAAVAVSAIREALAKATANPDSLGSLAQPSSLAEVYLVAFSDDDLRILTLALG